MKIVNVDHSDMSIKVSQPVQNTDTLKAIIADSSDAHQSSGFPDVVKTYGVYCKWSVTYCRLQLVISGKLGQIICSNHIFAKK